MKFLVKVTEEHIKKGKRGNPNSCPIAYAWKDIFPNAFKTHVQGYNDPQSGVWWSMSASSYKGNISCDLPGKVVMLIDSYDVTGEMKPFEFEVEI